MPITHRVDPDTRILFVTRSGSIDSQDEVKARRERQTDPLVVPGIRVVVDCREVNPCDSPEAVRNLADQITTLAEKLRCGPVAIVVATDIQYGMARMYQALTDLSHPDTTVFHDYGEAVEWIHARAMGPA